MSDLVAPDYCSLGSLALGEPLFGTAVYVNTWFLLEYRGTWTAKATDMGQNELPAEVQTWLSAQVAAAPNGRLQFIRQNTRRHTLSFVVVSVQPDRSRLYQFHLQRYEDLFDLDIVALLAGDALYAAHLRAAPLYLVCVHGKRDACCAKFGLEFYQALAQQVGTLAWQTTHLGGHRFAPTVLTLPDGACYGRLQLTDVPALISAPSSDDLLLDRLRGLTYYPPIVQVADYYVRQETGETQRRAFRSQAVQQLAPNRWQVQFADAAGQPISLELAQAAAALPVQASCAKPEIKMIRPFELVND